MKKIEETKKIYEATEIPSTLDERIQNVFQNEKKKEKRQRKVTRPIKWSLSLAGSFCLIFALLLNISPTFAESISEVPVLKEIAKVITIKKQEERNESELINVEQPAIQNTENKEMEEKVNKIIQEKVNILLEESKRHAKEIKDTIDAVGDPEAIFQPMEIRINYEVKYNKGDYLSFILIRSEASSSFYEEHFAYNINLKTGKDITLQDLLGKNSTEIANTQIKRQIEKRLQEDETSYFIEEDDELMEHGGSFKTIDEHTQFYINEKGNPVIFFDKYEIAPGYTGIPEFEIEK